MRIRTDTNGRDETLRLLMQATGEKTKTGALFAAAHHYLADKRNKEKCIEDLRGVTTWGGSEKGDIPVVDALSTSELPMELTIETRVGHDD